MKRSLLVLVMLCVSGHGYAGWEISDRTAVKRSQQNAAHGCVSAGLSVAFLSGAAVTAASSGHVKAPQAFLLAGGAILAIDSASWFVKARADLRGVVIGYRFK